MIGSIIFGVYFMGLFHTLYWTKATDALVERIRCRRCEITLVDFAPSEGVTCEVCGLRQYHTSRNRGSATWTSLTWPITVPIVLLVRSADVERDRRIRHRYELAAAERDVTKLLEDGEPK